MTMIEPAAGAGRASRPASLLRRHRLRHLAASTIRPTGTPFTLQSLAAAVVRLHEHADGEAAALRGTTREAVPLPPLKPWQIMPGAAADVALGDRPPRGGAQRLPSRARP